MYKGSRWIRKGSRTDIQGFSMGLWEFARVRKRIYEGTPQVCESLREFVMVHKCIYKGSQGVRKGLRGFARVREGSQMDTRIRDKFTTVHRWFFGSLRSLHHLMPEACPQEFSIFTTILETRSLGFLSFVHQEGDLAFSVRPNGGCAFTDDV